MRGERGFTLVEVVVVMAVLAVGMLACLQSVVLAGRLHGRGREMTAALLLAQDRLERLGVLGWERATASLALAAAPPQSGLPGDHPQETVNSNGRRFLLLYLREAAGEEPERHVVRCYWEGRGGGISARDCVTLSARRRRP